VWSAILGVDGTIRETPTPVATEGLLPDRDADIGLTGAAHGAIATFGSTEGGMSHIVLVALDASGHATRPPMRSRSFASVTHAIAMETRDGAAVVFEAAPDEAPGRASIWGMGFTCLR
jgi:hypothetical protein